MACVRCCGHVLKRRRSRYGRVECLDRALEDQQDGVVYRIPGECGKVYIGETGRPMQDRIKEHDRDKISFPNLFDSYRDSFLSGLI